MESTRTSPRRRPLHTCGVSILKIAHTVHTRSQDFNGPFGSMTRKITKLAKLTYPIIYALQYQCLAILSFADDRILAVEGMIEAICPPSEFVFNRIDNLVQIVETVPGKLEDVMNKFPVISNQVPLLDWALAYVISRLNFWIFTLTYWASENAKEKEITVVDSNSGGCKIASTAADKCSSTQIGIVNKESLPPPPVSPKSETDSGSPKVSYKEALEKGKKGNTEKKQDEKKEENAKEEEKEINESKMDEDLTEHDPILELFETGWLMKKAGENKGPLMARSVSYT